MTTSEPFEPTNQSQGGDGITVSLDVGEVVEQIAEPTPISGWRNSQAGVEASELASEVAKEVAKEEMASGSSTPTGPSRLSLVTPKSMSEQQALSEQIDRLSLEQALLDVEVANARVLDLTARLVEANQRIATLNLDVNSLSSQTSKVKVEAEVEVAAVRNEMLEKQAYLDAQRASSAFRWASKVWNIRNALRGS